ncbi:MAG TPA: VOC family protein [Bryobacteraceae bacterium]|nr:VOC family protein [Bryobacteraceae bacterium]
MQATAYLHFNGDCEAALRFYEQALGAEVDCLIPFEGTPAEHEAPAEYLRKVLHGRIKLNGQTIMASDCPPGRYKKPQGFALSLGVKDAAEAHRVFEALANGGTVNMPLQETFWAVRYGSVTDRFGTPWMVNCEKGLDLPAQEEEHAYAGRR